MDSSYLVLGGAGFVGRNFVTFLIDIGVPPTKIRVVDKVLLKTAWLNSRHLQALEKVDFRQASLMSPESIEKAFARADGLPWDFVVNLAAETKYSLSSDVYDQRVCTVSVNCAKEAAKNGAKVFVEVSTGQVYDGEKKASSEDAKTSPWTNLAKAKLKAESELLKIPSLNLVIVRPAIIYGPGDLQGITPRLIIGRVYKHLNEEMKFLWSKDLRINTVHVSDVCRALKHICEYYKDKKAGGEIFNLADKDETDQEAISVHIRAIFGIKTGFQGSILSTLAKFNLSALTEEVNDAHLEPWSELLEKSNIKNSPLTPYLDQELLYNNHLSISGAKIEEKLGFKYTVPNVTESSIREVIDGYKQQKIWPDD